MQRIVSLSHSTLLIPLVVIALAAAPIYAQPPDTLWTKVIGGSDGDYCYTIQQTADGNFVFFGLASYVNLGPNNNLGEAWAVKLDNLGNILWNQTYGGTEYNYAHDGQQTTDGGHILAGGIGDYPAADVWLVKTDASGNQTWAQNYNYSSHDGGSSVAQTTDGGYIITGIHNGMYYKNWTIKTDASGVIEWTREFGLPGAHNNEGKDVQQTSDGGYIVISSIHVESWSYDPRIRLTKLNADGDPQWEYDFGGSNWAYPYSVQQTDDGGYIFTGWTCPPGGIADVWLVKTDGSGTMLWDNTFGGSNSDVGNCVQLTDDGGYVIAGYTIPDGLTYSDIWIIKTDALGDMEWDCIYGGDSTDVGRSMNPTTDGGYIVGGYTDSFGAGGYDAWVLRLSPLFGMVAGSVTPAFEGITIDLLDGDEIYICSDLTAADGSYSFPDLSPSDYYVDLIEPLGFAVDQNHVMVSVCGGDTVMVDFELTETVTCNQARSVGFWKHQVRANLSGQGRPAYTTEELLGFTQDIFDHFYGNALNPIQVEGVTYVGYPEAPLSMLDLQYMLNINQGGSTLYERACRQFLALLLNVASDKVGQYLDASEDGANVSQAIVYIDEILGVNDALAKDIAETLNEGQLVEAGVIPLTTPNIIFCEGIEAVLHTYSFSFNPPAPNPFNPNTTLSFTLPEAAKVKLSVYDITGRHVAEVVNGWKNAGVHELTFDGSNLASGLYLYQLQAGEFTACGKMVLMK